MPKYYKKLSDKNAYEEVTYEILLGGADFSGATLIKASQKPKTSDELQVILEGFKREFYRLVNEKSGNGAKVDEVSRVLLCEQYLKNISSLQNLDRAIKRKLNSHQVLQTAEEIYNKLTLLLNNHKSSRRNEIESLRKRIAEIHNDTGLSDANKNKLYVEAILKIYDGIIRAFTGTPTSFMGIKTKGSTLALDLRCFCKQELGIELSNKLDGKETLSVDSPFVKKEDKYYLLLGETKIPGNAEGVKHSPVKK